MNTTACSENDRNQCDYFRFAQGGGDFSDIFALLLTYCVLWIKPETMLFPAGLAMYLISCFFSTIRIRSRAVPNMFKYIDHAVVLCLGIVAFMGINGEMRCMIVDGVNVITLSDSLRSLVAVQSFHTITLLGIAGVPICTASLRYIVSKVKNKKQENPVVTGT